MVCICGHVASVDSDKLFKSKHSGVTSAVLLGEGAVETAGVTEHVSSVPVCDTFSWLCHSVRSLDIEHHSGVCTEHMLGKPSSAMHACMHEWTWSQSSFVMHCAFQCGLQDE